jgi:hypothetical protein
VRSALSAHSIPVREQAKKRDLILYINNLLSLVLHNSVLMALVDGSEELESHLSISVTKSKRKSEVLSPSTKATKKVFNINIISKN